jgi:hypothetical protein
MRQLFETKEITSKVARRETCVVFRALKAHHPGEAKKFLMKANQDGTPAPFSNQGYLAKVRVFKLFCDLHKGQKVRKMAEASRYNRF